MSTLIVNGGRTLNGSISVHGSKNSVLPILSATIINSGVSTIHNCPRLRDVSAAIEILKHIGCKVEQSGDTVVVDSRCVTRCEVPDNLMREMRSSVIFMGAILARCGHISLFAPGGCELGARPIDLHTYALRQLGANIREEGGEITCSAKRLRGRDIVLSFPSVGATENTMLAATACEGRTRIINAAREPEIEDLQNFLVAMGAKVRGAGSSTVIIEGAAPLHDVEFTVIPDRIIAATYMCAAAICGGHVRVENMVPEHISTLVSILEGMGCEIKTGQSFADIKRVGKLRAVRSVRTLPYPGFPTDAQPPLMAAATRTDGTSLFVENIFDGRYRHVSELVRLGAQISVEGKIALVYGVPQLYGNTVSATDLRGGAALVIAAMSAEGKSEISGVSHIDRGYEKIEESMSVLGADIKRV